MTLRDLEIFDVRSPMFPAYVLVRFDQHCVTHVRDRRVSKAPVTLPNPRGELQRSKIIWEHNIPPHGITEQPNFAI